MSTPLLDPSRFADLLREAVQRQRPPGTTLRLARNQHVYTCGDIDRTVFYLHSGQVKLLLTAASGKESLLAIYTTGDIFGESCLTGAERRATTAIAMQDSVLEHIPCGAFLSLLQREGLLE